VAQSHTVHRRAPVSGSAYSGVWSEWQEGVWSEWQEVEHVSEPSPNGAPKHQRKRRKAQYGKPARKSPAL